MPGGPSVCAVVCESNIICSYMECCNASPCSSLRGRQVLASPPVWPQRLQRFLFRKPTALCAIQHTKILSAMFWIVLSERPPAHAGLHEDNERLVAAIVRDYQKDAKSHKEKLAQNHRVKKALDTLQLQSERLVRPFDDRWLCCSRNTCFLGQGRLRFCRTCIPGCWPAPPAYMD